MKNLLTHSGMFHADDVFATAALALVFNDQIKVTRSREEGDIEKADIVYDTGRVYDPKNNRFDHHQTGGAGERENGVPYAAFGLIWKHFGRELVSSDEVHEKVDEKLVQPIDANDTGYFGAESSIEDIENYVADKLIKTFNPTWSESYEVSYERFLELVEFAKKVLKREIKRAEDSIIGKQKVEDVYQKTEDKKIIVLDKAYAWREILSGYPEPLFVIFPEIDKNRFMIQAVYSSNSGYDTKTKFPESWFGKVDEELEEAAGVKGSTFCHNVGFLAVNETLVGAIEMAQRALE